MLSLGPAMKFSGVSLYLMAALYINEWVFTRIDKQMLYLCDCFLYFAAMAAK